MIDLAKFASNPRQVMLRFGTYEILFCRASAMFPSKFPKLFGTIETGIKFILGCIPGDTKTSGKLDKDGFPPIGSKLEYGDPCYWLVLVMQTRYLS